MSKNGTAWTRELEGLTRRPKNLRIEMEPYPHLRDDEGCVLARDYIHDTKMDFVLQAVREKLEREVAANG